MTASYHQPSVHRQLANQILRCAYLNGRHSPGRPGDHTSVQRNEASRFRLCSKTAGANYISRKADPTKRPTAPQKDDPRAERAHLQGETMVLKSVFIMPQEAQKPPHR